MKDWIEEAKRLRAGGMAYWRIGARLGRGETTVRSAINGRHDTHYGVLPATTADKPQSHKYRTPKQIVPREVIAEATLAFAKGKIDRAELMRRITPV